MIEMDLRCFIQRLGCITAVDGSAETNFLSYNRTDTGEGGVQGFGNIAGFPAYGIDKILLTDSQRIQFVLGLRNEIFPSGQNFTD